MGRIWPFRHFGLKVLSVALAVLLWMVVSGEEIVERSLHVPLEYQQVPDGLELMGVTPTGADVRVRGASGTLSRLSGGDLAVVVDLRAARPGPHVFQLTKDQVHAPAGVEVLQVSPSSAPFVFGQTVSRRVPIAPPPVSGTPADGFMLGAITVDPPNVELEGPASAFTPDAHGVTEMVSVEGARAPVREEVVVGSWSPDLRPKTPRSVTVTVDIVTAHERVVHVPVRFRNMASGVTASAVPAAVDVRLQSAQDVLAGAGPDAVDVSVDLAGLAVGHYALTASVGTTLAAGIVRSEPMTIQVQISRAK